MSIGEVRAELRATIEVARRGCELLELARSQADASSSAASTLLADSSHPEVARAHGALRAAAAETGPTRRRFEAVIHKTGDYLAMLG